jgi:hypothetical protein
MYVEFPSAVTVTHAWVYSASIQGGGAAKSSDSLVVCPPMVSHVERQASVMQLQMDPAENALLAAMPTIGAVHLKASASERLNSSNCSEPFHAAGPQRQALLGFPGLPDDSPDAMSIVDVAINPDGTLRDEWVWQSAGSFDYDQEALKAARRSTYTGARAYCQGVPAIYRFSATWSANYR